jgi:L,D-peptidoglycan transpeptidase YkuD (ErfK/YbiS/YcfS/YnhG family)
VSNILVVGNTLYCEGKTLRCAIGKGGFSSDKREGDCCTPLGVFLLRECWYRADHITSLQTQLSLKTISQYNGWCDDPKSTQYNRPITIPYAFSHEKLWRDDRLYDVVIPMGYNDDPPVAGRGSAIFMHIAKPQYEGTEGCVALALADLLTILPHMTPESQIEIRAE